MDQLGISNPENIFTGEYFSRYNQIANVWDLPGYDLSNCRGPGI